MPDNDDNFDDFGFEELTPVPEVEQVTLRPRTLSSTQIIQQFMEISPKKKSQLTLTKDYYTGDLIAKEEAMPIYTKLLDDLSDIDTTSSIVYTTHNQKAPYFILENGKEVYVAIDPRPFIKSNKFVEWPASNVLVHESKVNKEDYKAALNQKHVFRATKARVAEPIIQSKTYTVTEGKRYTFGLELETSSGQLPGWLDLYYNYEAVKDGSLRDDNGELWGGEYVTGVLAGDEGFKVAKSFINELAKRCTIDKKCGVHVHLGNDSGFSDETIVYLYKLCLDIEQDIFNMLPASRRKNVYCKTLKKFNFDNFLKATNPIHYKRQLEHLYNQIAGWVSNRSDFNPAIYSKFEQHPDGPKCGYNQSTARYSWINLVPALFNTRGNESYTIEFRPHSGTLNYIKIRNWTLICMGILHVAENYQSIIRSKKLSLKEVIELAYPKKAKELKAYIDNRTKLFSNVDYKESLDYQDNVNNEDESFRTI